MKEGIDGELRLNYFVPSAEGGEGTDGGKGWQRGRKEKRGGVGVMTEVLGDFLPLKFPGACTTALCVCACLDLESWGHARSRLSVYCLWEEVTVCCLAVLRHRSLTTADVGPVIRTVFIQV